MLAFFLLFAPGLVVITVNFLKLRTQLVKVLAPKGGSFPTQKVQFFLLLPLLRCERFKCRVLPVC